MSLPRSLDSYQTEELTSTTCPSGALTAPKRMFWTHHVARYTRMMGPMTSERQPNSAEEDVSHGLCAQTHFYGCSPCQEKQLWWKAPSESSSLSVLSTDRDSAHTEPGQDLIPWGHCSTPGPGQGQRLEMKTRLVLLMSMWLHQGLGVVFVECDAHCTVQHSWSPSNTQQHWSPALFAGDFGLLSGHATLPSLYPQCFIVWKRCSIQTMWIKAGLENSFFVISYPLNTTWALLVLKHMST